MNLLDVKRRGFCALRITASPCEWEWTQKEQEEMAAELLRLDTENEGFRRGIRERAAKLKCARELSALSVTPAEHAMKFLHAVEGECRAALGEKMTKSCHDLEGITRSPVTRSISGGKTGQSGAGG